MKRRSLSWIWAVLFTALPVYSAAQVPLPVIRFGVEQAKNPQDVALGLQILFLLTILSLAPAILIMTTAFTRIIVVLSFLRQGLGTQQVPPNQVLIGLALFLTFFVMQPTFLKIQNDALTPYMNGKMPAQEALKKAEAFEEIMDYQKSVRRQQGLGW